MNTFQCLQPVRVVRGEQQSSRSSAELRLLLDFCLRLSKRGKGPLLLNSTREVSGTKGLASRKAELLLLQLRRTSATHPFRPGRLRRLSSLTDCLSN